MDISPRDAKHMSLKSAQREHGHRARAIPGPNLPDHIPGFLVPRPNQASLLLSLGKAPHSPARPSHLSCFHSQCGSYSSCLSAPRPWVVGFCSYSRLARVLDHQPFTPCVYLPHQLAFASCQIILGLLNWANLYRDTLLQGWNRQGWHFGSGLGRCLAV